MVTRLLVSELFFPQLSFLPVQALLSTIPVRDDSRWRWQLTDIIAHVEGGEHTSTRVGCKALPRRVPTLLEDTLKCGLSRNPTNSKDRSWLRKDVVDY